MRGLLTLFRSGTYASTLNDLIRNPASNTLIIFGTKDEFTSEANYDAWVHILRNEGDGEGKGRLEVVKVAGATHFWGGEYGRELQRVIEDWLP